MANKFTRFLKDIGTGATTPKGVMANFQHATRLFIDDSLRLAPRTKFNYYVRFELDPTAIRSLTFTQRHINEVGMLVKRADLPKFNFDTKVKNQYNRKKLIYHGFNYEPIKLDFHDDAAGITNALWALYYGTYIADRSQPTQAYSATHLRPGNTGGLDNFRYGLDNGKTVDMIKSISIYTMSRRRFLGYTLINPRITNWAHSNLDYSASEFAENTMTVQYETVIYSGGNVSYNNPKGFATLHYDVTPSPLTVQGGGVANLLGDGGVLDGLESIFGDVGNGTAFGSLGGFLGTAIKSVNTYRNFKNLSSDGIKSEVINILSSPEGIRGAVNTVGGIIGAVFPRNSATNPNTPASQRNIISGR